MMIIAAVSIHLQTMLAGIEVIFLVICSVFSLFAVYITHKTGSAYRTFYNAAELVFVLQIMLLLQALCSGCSLLFSKLKLFFRNDGIMLPVINGELILFHNMELISCAFNLFSFPSAVSDLSTINRIIQYCFYSRDRKPCQMPVLPCFFVDALLSQVLHHPCITHICVSELIEDNPDRLCLIFSNL